MDGHQPFGLAGEIAGEIGDVLRRQRLGHAAHDRVLAGTILIIAQHLAQIIFVLAGQSGINRDVAVAIRAMAGRAGRAFGLAGGGVAPNRVGRGGGREARQIGGDVLHVLLVEREGVGVHGGMFALAGLVGFERDDDVVGMLAT